MVRLPIDEGKEVFLDILVAPALAAIVFLLETKRNLVKRDDSPVVIALLDQNMLAAPFPGSQALDVAAPNQEHPDAALTHHLAVLAGHHQEPRLTPVR